MEQLLPSGISSIKKFPFILEVSALTQINSTLFIGEPSSLEMDPAIRKADGAGVTEIV